jgi:hypothetical protein
MEEEGEVLLEVEEVIQEVEVLREAEEVQVLAVQSYYYEMML